MNKKYNLEQTSHLKTIVFLKQLIIEYSKSNDLNILLKNTVIVIFLMF